MAVYVGEPALEAIVVITEPLMVESHEVKNGGVKVIHARAMVHGFEAKLITGTLAHARLHAGAGHEAGERAGVVVAPGAVAL